MTETYDPFITWRDEWNISQLFSLTPDKDNLMPDLAEYIRHVKSKSIPFFKERVSSNGIERFDFSLDYFLMRKHLFFTHIDVFRTDLYFKDHSTYTTMRTLAAAVSFTKDRVGEMLVYSRYRLDDEDITEYPTEVTDLTMRVSYIENSSGMRLFAPTFVGMKLKDKTEMKLSGDRIDYDVLGQRSLQNRLRRYNYPPREYTIADYYDDWSRQRFTDGWEPDEDLDFGLLRE